MIAASEYIDRCRDIAQAGSGQGLDAILAVGIFPEREGHVCYLTGHRLWRPQWPRSRRTTGAGYSFVLVSGSGVELFACAADTNVDQCAATAVHGAANVTAALGRRIAALGFGRIGVAGMDLLPASVYLSLLDRDISIVDAERLMFERRLIKSTAEIEILEEGAALADVAIEAGKAASRPAMNEREIAARIVGKALELGAEHVLRCRCRSGPQTGIVRWPYSLGRVLESGDPVQIDLVGIHKNYLFDISRVWSVGPAVPQRSDAIERAEAITQSLARTIEPGKQIRNSIIAWRISNGQRSAHSIKLDGHSIGTDIVEPPWITDNEDTIWAPGMVFCVEPSVVLENGEEFKHEETVVVTQNGSRVLGKI